MATPSENVVPASPHLGHPTGSDQGLQDVPVAEAAPLTLDLHQAVSVARRERRTAWSSRGWLRDRPPSRFRELLEEPHSVDEQRVRSFEHHNSDRAVAPDLELPQLRRWIPVGDEDLGRLPRGLDIAVHPVLAGRFEGGLLRRVLRLHPGEDHGRRLHPRQGEKQEEKSQLHEGGDDHPAFVAEQAGAHGRRPPKMVRFTSSNSSTRKSRAAPTKIISPARTPAPTWMICSVRVSAVFTATAATLIRNGVRVSCIA